ncbi:MAG TPA: rRNA maturation RNase YbeY [Longimicrobiales bacterium]|nr:rRNA maturation RNase YbeY [Longimicrobiales bacterium]
MAATVRVQAGAALSAVRGAAPAATTRRLMERAARAALRHARAEAPWESRRLYRMAEISITLLDDFEIAALNEQFLQHGGPTDVISFALFAEGEPPVGDIYVGVTQARRQAESAGVPFEEELARLAVHGVLHVLGHTHPDGAARLESEMWQVQEAILRSILGP